MKLLKDIPQLTSPGTYCVDYPITSISRFIHEQESEAGLQLNPDFQRGHVWQTEQQIAYIEFLLRGGKSGRVIYLNCPSWQIAVAEDAYNDFVCVDGLQRLTAVMRFTAGEIPAFGSYISEYSDILRMAKNTLKVNINTLDSKAKVLQWYLEINSCGTPHTSEEIARIQKMLSMEILAHA